MLLHLVRRVEMSATVQHNLDNKVSEIILYNKTLADSGTVKHNTASVTIHAIPIHQSLPLMNMVQILRVIYDDLYSI